MQAVISFATRNADVSRHETPVKRNLLARLGLPRALVRVSLEVKGVALDAVRA